MKKVIVFDLGGTLMEYEGMPLSWIPYYETGFSQVNHRLNLDLSGEEIQKSVEILKEYNPRFHPREVEIPPEEIFIHAIKHWHQAVTVKQVIEVFFQGLSLVPRIYEDTLTGLKQLRKMGYKTACFTNLPSGMPDEIFQKGIPELIDSLDLYMSSALCGYRKPNRAGLDKIAEKFQVPTNKLLFVGDESIDAEAAYNAGCPFVFMNRGKKPIQRQETASVETMGELISQGLGREIP